MEQFKDLFLKYQKTKRSVYKEKLVYLYLDLVKIIVRRFAYRGEPLDDLIQVGTLGLIKAIERYDPRYGTQFSTFATPTIIGEIKHYFRDETRSIKIPRRLEEIEKKVRYFINQHIQKNGCMPQVKTIAESLGVNEEMVLEAMEVSTSNVTLSLDAPLWADNDDNNLLSCLIQIDEHNELEGIINIESLKHAISCLTQREQRIIHMRFYQNLNQEEISKKLKISQVHVSRLLKHALHRAERIIHRQAKQDHVTL